MAKAKANTDKRPVVRIAQEDPNSYEFRPNYQERKLSDREQAVRDSYEAGASIAQIVRRRHIHPDTIFDLCSLKREDPGMEAIHAEAMRAYAATRELITDARYED